MIARFFFHHWFPALVALIFFGIPTLWALDNTPPVDIRKVTPVEKKVRRGGSLFLTYDVVRKRDCPGEVQRIFVDVKDIVHAAEPYRFNSGVGRDGRTLTLGAEDFIVSAPVPFGAAPGPAKFRSVIEYWCNPIQKILGRGILVTTPAVEFEVLLEIAANIDPPERISGGFSLSDAELMRRPSYWNLGIQP